MSGKADEGRGGATVRYRIEGTDEVNGRGEGGDG